MGSHCSWRLVDTTEVKWLLPLQGTIALWISSSVGTYLGCVFVTTDKGTDFRVCKAGIWHILGFAQLELASVPEKLSVNNFCFCDDGLASRDRFNTIKWPGVINYLSRQKKLRLEGFFRVPWNPSCWWNWFTDKNVIPSHVGTGMIVRATWKQTEQSVKTQLPWPMAHGSRCHTKAAIQRVKTSNQGNSNQDWQLQERWLHDNLLDGRQQQQRWGQKWGQCGSNSGGKEAGAGAIRQMQLVDVNKNIGLGYFIWYNST